MRRCAKKARVPIAVGENLQSYYAFENFIVRGAVDFIQPDVARAGGITEIKRITALAAKHNVPVSFHTWGDGVALAASVHLSAALKDCIVMELDYTYNPLREELLNEPFKVQNGFLTPPEKPGLGIELNPQALERFAFAGAEDLAIRQKTLAGQLTCAELSKFCALCIPIINCSKRTSTRPPNRQMCCSAGGGYSNPDIFPPIGMSLMNSR